MPLDKVIALIVPALLPFNLIKIVINCVVFVLIMRPAFKAMGVEVPGASNAGDARQMAQPATTSAASANASEAPIVSLAHVTLSYGDLRAPRQRLARRAPRAPLCLSANGSGKSTLASVICGSVICGLAPDAGEVTLVGEKVFGRHRGL